LKYVIQVDVDALVPHAITGKVEEYARNRYFIAVLGYQYEK
jgi:hypothetical protein